MRTLCLTGLAVGCVLHLCAGLAVGQTTKPRAPEQIISEIEQAAMPPMTADQRKDKELREKYWADQAKAQAKQAELAWELYLADPSHADLDKHLQARWRYLAQQQDLDSVLKETGRVVAEQKGNPLAGTAAFFYADATGDKHGNASKEFVKAIEAYRQIEPDKPRGATLYMTLAGADKDPAAATKHYRKVMELYPSTRTARTAEGKIRQMEGVGKPFKVDFTDAITGKKVSMNDLKGKVVVVDFWATWCGPCIAEMPHMKELYAQYKDRGVEFIGISLDNPEDKGGLTALKDYCKTNEIGWPQYYQGAGWDSEFSGSWGINGIPALFIVDKQGNLHSTKARGKLDELIPELLKK
jgi:thiol-disulfide isomerase/thioredoxin